MATEYWPGDERWTLRNEILGRIEVAKRQEREALEDADKHDKLARGYRTQANQFHRVSNEYADLLATLT